LSINNRMKYNPIMTNALNGASVVAKAGKVDELSRLAIKGEKIMVLGPAGKEE